VQEDTMSTLSSLAIGSNITTPNLVSFAFAINVSSRSVKFFLANHSLVSSFFVFWEFFFHVVFLAKKELFYKNKICVPFFSQ
jgi:hypothetical protein